MNNLELVSFLIDVGRRQATSWWQASMSLVRDLDLGARSSSKY